MYCLHYFANLVHILSPARTLQCGDSQPLLLIMQLLPIIGYFHCPFLYPFQLHYTLLWDAENRMTHRTQCVHSRAFVQKQRDILSCPQHPSWWWPRFCRLFWLPLSTDSMSQRNVSSAAIKSLSLDLISVLMSAPCRQGSDSFSPRCITSCLSTLKFTCQPLCLRWPCVCRLGNVIVYFLL